MAVWVGSYGEKGGEGLYRLAMQDGRMVVAGVEPRIANASFGVASAHHGVAYFVDEQEQGRITAWHHQPAWERMSSLPSGGAAPCHLALSADERWLACANYANGAVAIFSIDPSTGDVLEMVSQFTAAGETGPDPQRQDDPHAHCVVFTRDGDTLYHVDLGLDRVFRHDLDEGRIVASQVALAAPAGAGPRHLLFHPDGIHALLICELSAQLLLLIHKPDGTLACVDAVATSPGDDANDNLGGHLACDADGHVLVTNRGNDNLARFAVSGGKLELRDWRATGGASPRHFLQQDGAVLVAHEESGSLTHVRWDRSTTLPIGRVPGAAFVIDLPD